MAVNFYGMTATELAAYLETFEIKKFRAQQLFKWIYGQRVTEYAAMTDISKKLRAEFPNLLDLRLPPLITEHVSKDGTRKFLFDMGDGKSVESVLIPSGDRLTLCVSSEVGCNMACRFCYTAKQKLQKRLTAAEIVGQLVASADRLPNEIRITNVVFMGMGEPLDNSDEVFRAIDIMHHSWGLNMSRKKITVSTSGIVPEIHKVAESGARLAVSLNGVNDEVRTRVMPINKRWPLKELLEACRSYCQETGDLVTFEYVLLKGVTDSVEDARALYQLTKDIPCKINIIPFNEHPNSGFQRPSEKAIQRFQEALMSAGSHVLRRKTMGRDIYAACGQLTTVAKQSSGPERPVL